MSQSDDFRKIWATMAQRETIVDQAPNQTIVPPSVDGRLSRSKYSPLPHFAVKQSDEPLQFSLGELIGEGGMGRINLAVQVPLARQVAVKSIRPEKLSDSTVRELLREAWLTGSLEHPNIVPVYALGECDMGPILVMKRIEGTAWSAYLGDAERLRAEKGPHDTLEWHLETLLQVCQAVKFAHSKGIIHRDLKSENVMIGRFGEVYVLDWGIAVSLVPDESGRLPLASEVRSVAGTPHYMAPEMAEAKGERISEQTDVYLLGALLHEIITGSPRHTGQTIYEILMHAFVSAPVQYERTVPHELAEICNRACHRLPEERFETVEQLEQALRQYLHHRSSLQLSVEAQSSLTTLLERAELVSEDDPSSAATVYDLFGACRFGFQQARREWAENPDARKGLQLAVETMIGFELRQRNARAAERLIADLPEPRPDLQEEIRRQLERERAEDEELARMRRDLDLSIGTRTRAFLSLIIGALFFAVPGALGIARMAFGYEMSHGMFWLVGVFFFCAVLGLLYWARDTMTKTETNRRVTRAVIAICIVSFVARTSVWILGIGIDAAMVIETLVFAMGLSVSVATIDLRLVWALPPMLIAAVLAPLAPRWAFLTTGLGVFVTMMLIVRIWRPDDFFFPENGRVRSVLERHRRRQGK